ncbi:MAG: DnaJ domain-containing protein [Bacteroidota bacterium]
MINYYEILGVSENANTDEIKTAFKRQAVKYHPDKHQGKPEMEERFKEINEAYQILSDSYEKARFDLKLKYQQFSSSTPPYPYTQQQYRRRPHYEPASVDYKKNTIATLYAFGITLAIALIVMSGVWIKESYDQMKINRKLTERRELYKKAKLSFDNGDYEHAFQLMDNMKFFRLEERDIKLFKDNMIDSVIERGDQYFNDEFYNEAIYLYELVQKFEINKPLFSLKGQLAKAYLEIGRPEKSIEIYEGLMEKEYRIISSMIAIGEIQRDQMNDLLTAKEYYLNAHKRAVKQYTKFYGAAYSLVINGQHLPTEHYELYTGLADIYYRLGEYELAIKASKWNKYVWPDSADAYLNTAKVFSSLNQKANACNELNGAIIRGWKGTPIINCN